MKFEFINPNNDAIDNFNENSFDVMNFLVSMKHPQDEKENNYHVQVLPDVNKGIVSIVLDFDKLLKNDSKLLSSVDDATKSLILMFIGTEITYEFYLDDLIKQKEINITQDLTVKEKLVYCLLKCLKESEIEYFSKDVLFAHYKCKEAIDNDVACEELNEILYSLVDKDLLIDSDNCVILK